MVGYLPWFAFADALGKSPGMLLEKAPVLAVEARQAIAAEAFAKGIRAEGKAVEANLLGFEAGLAAADAMLVSAEAFGEQTAGGYTVLDVFFFGGKGTAEPETIPGEKGLIERAWNRVASIWMISPPAEVQARPQTTPSTGVFRTVSGNSRRGPRPSRTMSLVTLKTVCSSVSPPSSH